VSQRSETLIEKYPIPSHWEWLTLGAVTSINPRDAAIRRLPDNFPVTFVPMSAVDADRGIITQAEERPLAAVRKGFTPFVRGDVLFAKITPSMENGKAAIADPLQNNIGFGSTEFHVLRPLSGINPGWIFYYIRQATFRRDAKESFTGTAGQLRVPTGFLQRYPIPIPPVDEQKRIVELLRVLFAESTSARDAFDRIPSLVNDFRQAVLAAAFNGKLTQRGSNDEPATILLEQIKENRRQRWRDDHHAKGEAHHEEPVEPNKDGLPQLPDDWALASLDQLIERIDAGRSPQNLHRPAKANEYGVLKVSALSRGKFLPDENKALLPGTRPEQRLTVQAGDLLISRANTVALAGAVVLADQHYPNLMLSDKTLRLITVPEISPKYLLYALRSPIARRYLEQSATGTSDSMRNISQAKMRMVPIPLSPVPEQARLIDLVDRLHTELDMLGDIASAGSERCSNLEERLLEKAFRGELGSIEHDHEPVGVPLERTRQEVEVQEENKSMARRPSSTASRKAKRRRIAEVLREAGEPLTSADLFSRAGFTFENVEQFYVELRVAITNKEIEEVRPTPGGEVHLEAAAQ
jgi:type I restriction enzyme, S subunit